MEHPMASGEAQDTEGGDPACWAHLVCPECAAVEAKGHRRGCSYEQVDASGTDRTTES
ncbi:MAG: hypothetical protein ACP5P1_15120 [Acidimicrobiales bacterium]